MRSRNGCRISLAALPPPLPLVDVDADVVVAPVAVAAQCRLQPGRSLPQRRGRVGRNAKEQQLRRPQRQLLRQRHGVVKVLLQPVGASFRNR